jgi:phospholipid transport system substrate-binding protein
MGKHILIFFSGLVGVLWAAAPVAVLGASADEAEQLVRETTNQVLEALKAERAAIKTNPKRAYGIINDIVVPHFDFDLMSRWVLGKHWPQASAAQQREFIEQFRGLIVRTYAASLQEYEGQQVSVLGARGEGKKDRVSVSMQVVRMNGVRVPVEYKMRYRGGEWKVYDVLIDGISLIANYRSNFDSEIRQHGMDGLIERMVERNRDGGGPV